MPYPGLLQPELLSLRQSTADPYLHRILKHSSVSDSVGSLGPGATKVCLSPLSISSGFYCKCSFDLPTIGNSVKFPFFYPLIGSILWNSNLTLSLSFPYLSGRYRQP